MAFEPEALYQHLTRILPGDSGRLLVAYSGGCDSRALLHACAALRGRLSLPLEAVHVNHGLHPEADTWADHCIAVCSTLEIPLVTLNLSLEHHSGRSLEELAREERYRALSDFIGPGDVLLTAHHQDDQAETVLLQLLRGAGPKGLAAMAETSDFYQGYHCRPLLSVSGDDLQAYATEACPGWLEDSSNLDMRFDRNLLRNSIIPELKKRWPGLATTLSRSAAHCAEAQQIVDQVAEQDLEQLLDPEDMSLRIDQLLSLPEARIHTALRHWIQQQGYALPSLVRLRRIVDEVCCAAEDRTPQVHWSGVMLQRYRNRLYIMEEPESLGDSPVRFSWAGTDEIDIPQLGLTIGCRQGSGGVSMGKWLEGELEIGFRQPGLRCRPAGRGGSVSLKKLFQELGIPPWQRQRVPLLFIDGEVAAVADKVICEPFSSDQEHTGMHLTVQYR